MLRQTPERLAGTAGLNSKIFCLIRANNFVCQALRPGGGLLHHFAGPPLLPGWDTGGTGPAHGTMEAMMQHARHRSIHGHLRQPHGRTMAGRQPSRQLAGPARLVRHRALGGMNPQEGLEHVQLQPVSPRRSHGAHLRGSGSAARACLHHGAGLELRRTRAGLCRRLIRFRSSVCGGERQLQRFLPLPADQPFGSQGLG